MNGTIPALQPDFLTAVEVLVGITCPLSILGASLIILTYIAYKDLRTAARQILVNLSIADWIVAAAHFAGIFQYKRFIPRYNEHYRRNTDTLCSIQGAFAMFGSVASFLWTMALAGYMFTIIVLRRPRLAMVFVVLFYFVCWGVPVGLTIWFGVKDFFGFQETSDIVSCFLRNVSADYSDAENIYPEVLGYDGWSYLVFIVLPPFYIATFCHMRCKRPHRETTSASPSPRSWFTNVDMKLIFVPLLFLVLRVWSAIIDIIFIFISSDEATRFRSSEAVAAFVMLASVGNSAQGLVNGILFCVFTPQVRRRLWRTLTSPCRRCLGNQFKELSETVESTTQFDESSVESEQQQSTAFFDSTSTSSLQIQSSLNNNYGSTSRSGRISTPIVAQV